MPTSTQIAYGVILALLVGSLVTMVFIYAVRRRRRRTPIRISTDTSPHSPCGNICGPAPLAWDQPPAYEAVVSNGRENRVIIPVPTPDQMGTYTTEYVTGVEPSHQSIYPMIETVSTERGIIVLNRPFPEMEVEK